MTLLSQLPAEYDLVVIGAGIHGAAVAREAAASGLRVLVLEQATQAASATSSKSSKLIHGGLRYLETGQLALVRECLREQAVLLRTAAPLVHRSDFVIPVYAHMQRRAWQIQVGLWLYAVLGGRWPRRLPLASAPSLGLRGEDLHRLFSYSDAQTDDAALTRSVLASAQLMGADAHFNTRVEQFYMHENSVELKVLTHGQPHTIVTRALVNAAGAWVNSVAQATETELPTLAIELVRGTHIELPGALPACCYLEASDGRAVFALPWRGHRLVGTTESLFTGDPAQCVPSAKEIYYLLETCNRYFSEQIKPEQVLASWAGLRVLPKATVGPYSRKRDAIIVQDHQHQPRYLAIYGGKLTSHRATASKVVRALHYLRADDARVFDTARQYLPLV